MLVQGKVFLQALIKIHLEDVVEVREILKASHKNNEFPYYAKLEHSWNMLEKTHYIMQLSVNK